MVLTATKPSPAALANRWHLATPGQYHDQLHLQETA